MTTANFIADARPILAEHPEVAAVQPSWSDSVTAHHDVDETIGFGFAGDFGSVELSRSVVFDPATRAVRIMDDGKVFLYFSAEDRPVTAEALRIYAADFLAAAAAMEASK